jgi:hypothetical protein
MAEVKKRKKTYPELLNALGNALLKRGELEDELANYIQARHDQRCVARQAKWFSEDRYLKWAEYYQIKASIVAVREDIKRNNLTITHLEDEISACRPAATAASPIPPEL